MGQPVAFSKSTLFLCKLMASALNFSMFSLVNKLFQELAIKIFINFFLAVLASNTINNKMVFSFYIPRIAKETDPLIPCLFWSFPMSSLTTKLMQVSPKLSNKNFFFSHNISPYLSFFKLVTCRITLADVVFFLPSYPITLVRLVKLINNEPLFLCYLWETC